MDIADIGNACKKFEEYQEGKVPLKDVIRAVVDMTPAGTILGTGEKIATSGADYNDTRNKINDANATNLEAYLIQWENRFYKAGMSKKEARKYVSAAVLAGNLELLEAKAELLQSSGKKITPPKLVVEEHLGPDGGRGYMWENTKDLAQGMWQGTKDGVGYIIYAPSRTVEAWGEGELAEADLNYNSQTATAEMKTRLFKKLFNSGITRQRALAAVSGSQSLLKEVAKEAREKLTKIREEQAKVQAQRDEFDLKLKACMREIARLRFSEASIKTTPPSPLKVPAETSNEGVFPVELSLLGSFTDRVDKISRMLESLTGKAPQVSYTYQCSIQSAKKRSPSSWEIEVPGQPGNYPVKVFLKVTITSFPGIYKPIRRTIYRTVRGIIAVKPSTENIRFTQNSYSLESEYSKELRVKVTNQSLQGHYFYDWLIGGEHFTTTKPTLTFTPHLKKQECPTTLLATVLLCDRDSGCVLDEAKADLTVVYPDKPPLDAWVVLKKTSEVVVEVEHLYYFYKKMKTSSKMSFQLKKKRKVPDWNQLYEDLIEVTLQIAADGKSITHLEFEIISYYIGSLDGSEKGVRKLADGTRYHFSNLQSLSIRDETSTQEARVTYRADSPGTIQMANVNNDGQLNWGKVMTCGNINKFPQVKSHIPTLLVYFSMSSEEAQKKVAKTIDIRNEKKEVRKQATAKSLGGLIYEGPFATKTRFKAKITINVGNDHTSVSGNFKGETIIKKGKSKAVLEGEFLGSIGLDGRFEARITSGSIIPWSMKDGAWWPRVLQAKNIPSGAKLLEKLQGETISGDMVVRKKHGYQWTAKLKK